MQNSKLVSPSQPKTQGNLRFTFESFWGLINRC